jgi:8-oxo-dGTP pyrophosphatase MutT (NUDIX family)/GNAT superfamily N-acetyltransferase
MEDVKVITYRKATADDVHPALELALRVFVEYEAPHYEPEAVPRFKADIVYNEAAIQNWRSGASAMYVACIDDKIVGVVGEKWRNGHINIVFVDGAYHRRGIATELMNRIVCDLKLHGFHKITLFSSPYGLPFYLKYGFATTDTEQHRDGFIFTPMEYIPNEIWDVLDKDGNKTGRYHERGRKMEIGDCHLVVYVWKHNGRGEWLSDRRVKKSPDDQHGGKWETTGGAAIAGDDSLTAALRETKEELGLDLDPMKGVLFRRFAREGFFGHTSLMDVWVFRHDCEIEDIRYQESETSEAMWATADEIRRLIEGNEFFSDVEGYFDDMVEKWRTKNDDT